VKIVEYLKETAVEWRIPQQGSPVPVSEHGQVTRLLRAWSAGDEAALGRLVPLVEAELRRLARAYMARERRGHTLQTTALVNEVYMRLIDAHDLRWQDRAHFLGISARLMRRVLVDHARARGYKKRGAGAQRVTLDEAMAVAPALDVDIVALDRALDALAQVDERKSRVIAALLRRADRGRDRRCAAPVDRHNQTRLASGEAVAVARARRRP